MLVTLTPLPLGCLQKVQEKQRVPEVRTTVLNRSLNTTGGWEWVGKDPAGRAWLYNRTQ